MEDYALNKKVLEYCNHASFMTDGVTSEYDGKTGYLGIHTPGYVTVDLQDSWYVKHICFELWDFDDPNNLCPDRKDRTNQLYSYRLLISDDRKTWRVVYDCSNSPAAKKYRKGWQSFIWEEPVSVRYIRIHCLNGKRNSGFHIVKLHACNEVFNLCRIDTEVSFSRTNSFEIEYGDAYPLSYQLNDFSGRIQDAFGSRVQMDLEAKGIYDSIVDYLFRKSREVDAVNGKVDEIRRLIAQPVKEEIQELFQAENKDSRSNIRFSIAQMVIWSILFVISFFFIHE